MDTCKCNACKLFVDKFNIFLCFMCSIPLCEQCVTQMGQWYHCRQLCQYCNGHRYLFHDLHYLCSRNCEMSYKMHYNL